MIGQNQSLAILMPIAIEVLRNNILAEGNLYPGDLLKSVLTVDAGFWNTHPDMKEEIMAIFEHNRDAVLSSEDNGGKVARELLAAYESLKGI